MNLHLSRCRSGSHKGGLSKAGDAQQSPEKPPACQVCPTSIGPHQDSAAAGDLLEENAGRAEPEGVQKPTAEAPGMGRRLRSADLLGRQGSPAGGQERGGQDRQGAEQGLRASLFDSIASHTRLLRSSSR